MATGTVLEVVMPQMGVSVSEGTVTRWLRNVGDTVAADEAVLEVSTDKVDTEVPSPGTGVLREILVPEGETVAVGTVLARIDVAAAAAAAAAEDEDGAGEDAPEEEPAQSSPAAADGSATPVDDGHTGPSLLAHTFVSPVVARIAAEHGIDPSTLSGSGRGGRVTKKDVLALVEHEPVEEPAGEPHVPRDAPVERPAVERRPAPEPPGVSPHDGAPAARQVAAAAPVPAAAAAPSAYEADSEPELGPGESLEPMSIMRRGIAEHMRRSLDTAAHVTSVIEVDMSKVASIRDRIKSDFAAAYGVNPTYLSFIARATVETLRDWPWVNAELRGESILTHTHVNLGIAVSLEGGKGLIVPVLKHAEGLNLLGMARGIADLAERARTRRLLPDDVQGGTFTVTNPGSYGTLLGTPIISQPQSAILGTYAIVKRPWVIADERGMDAIAVRSIMNLTLTYDHRLVDGAYGAQFLRDLAGRLEGWGESDY